MRTDVQLTEHELMQGLGCPCGTSESHPDSCPGLTLASRRPYHYDSPSDKLYAASLAPP